jgi:hypothetical protein
MIADILNIVFSAPLVENFINMSNFKRIYTLFSVYVHPNLSKSLTNFFRTGRVFTFVAETNRKYLSICVLKLQSFQILHETTRKDMCPVFSHIEMFWSHFNN